MLFEQRVGDNVLLTGNGWLLRFKKAVFVLTVEQMYSFMQLDLGYLKVSNEFEWHGGLKENDSAIHLDVLSAEVVFSVCHVEGC